jgi:hypothetical protein
LFKKYVIPVADFKYIPSKRCLAGLNNPFVAAKMESSASDLILLDLFPPLNSFGTLMYTYNYKLHINYIKKVLQERLSGEKFTTYPISNIQKISVAVVEAALLLL